MMVYCSTSYSQIKIHAGAGINSSNLQLSSVSTNFGDIKSTLNYFIGLRPEIGLTEKWAIGVDVQLSHKGYQYSDQNLTNPSAYRFQFIDLLPQVEYKIISKAAIYGGVGIAIRTGEKFKFNDAWKESVYKLSNNVDPTYVIGARFFPLNRLSLQVHFAGSLKDFLDIEFSDSSGNILPKGFDSLQNIQFGIAYQVL